jgi:hypothetical protein
MYIASYTHSCSNEYMKQTKNCRMCNFPCSTRCIKGESVGLCIPLLLQDTGLVNKLPQQQRIAGGVIFYVVYVTSYESRRFHVTSYESRRLILPGTSSLHNRVYVKISKKTCFNVTKTTPLQIHYAGSLLKHIFSMIITQTDTCYTYLLTVSYSSLVM